MNTTAEGAQGSANSKTPDHLYASPLATTEREVELFKAIACACASQGMLYDDGLKEAVFSFVRPLLYHQPAELFSALRSQLDVSAELRSQLAQSEERVKELEGALQLMLNQADANPDFCRTYTPESRETARALLSSSKTN